MGAEFWFDLDWDLIVTAHFVSHLLPTQMVLRSVELGVQYFGQGNVLGVSDSNHSDNQDSSLTSNESGVIDSTSASSGDTSSGSNTFHSFQLVIASRFV